MRSASRSMAAISPSSRGSTARLTSAMILRHSCQLSKLKSISVPIIITSSASGYRRLSSAAVSDV